MRRHMTVKKKEASRISPRLSEATSRSGAAVTRLSETRVHDNEPQKIRNRSDDRDELRGEVLAMAISYANKGWPVVPLWSRLGDSCGCGNPNCESQGKHPIGKLTPHGSKDAT